MIKKSAIFSPCRKYRYTLLRIWKEEKGLVNFIGLNPSTADENIDDPTIRRCIRFAYSWGFGGIIMTNLFGFRATNPKEMMMEQDPTGDNDHYIIHSSLLSEITVCAWGVHGKYKGRDKAVLELIRNPKCLDKTKDGYPKHPLYLKKDLVPIPFS